MKRNLHIVKVEHMDEVLPAALSLADPGSFLRAGDHAIEDLYEELPPPGKPVEEHRSPAGVN